MRRVMKFSNYPDFDALLVVGDITNTPVNYIEDAEFIKQQKQLVKELLLQLS